MSWTLNLAPTAGNPKTLNPNPRNQKSHDLLRNGDLSYHIDSGSSWLLALQQHAFALFIQRLQNPLLYLRKHALNHIRDPTILTITQDNS